MSEKVEAITTAERKHICLNARYIIKEGYCSEIKRNTAGMFLKYEARFIVLEAREKELREAFQEFLVDEECSRERNGKCSIRKCLLEGGYSGQGKVDHSIATCRVFRARATLKGGT